MIQKGVLCLLLSKVVLSCVQITSVSLRNGGEKTDISPEDEIGVYFTVDGGSSGNGIDFDCSKT